MNGLHTEEDIKKLKEKVKELEEAIEAMELGLMRLFGIRKIKNYYPGEKE